MKRFSSLVSLKGAFLYRKLRYRRGYGIHSPFVFNLVTKVINERCPFYVQDEIESIRKRIQLLDKKIKYPSRKSFTPKKGALLLRLTNYFTPATVLQIGSLAGFPSLYMTAYASHVKCIVLEKEPELAELAGRVFNEYKKRFVDFRPGEYEHTLSAALQALGSLDFVFLDLMAGDTDNDFVFSRILPLVHPGTVLALNQIKASDKRAGFWKRVCRHPDVTVTIDLYSLGLIFFDKKLHKQNYIVSF